MIGLGTGRDIRVGRQTKAGNLGNIAEELTDHILVNIERQVADEEGVALGADGVTVLLGALVGAGLGVGVVGLAGSEVKVDLATIDLLARHGLVSLGSRGGISKVNVAETTAATSSTVRDNTSADDALAVLESLVQAIIINAPGQAASEESLGATGVGLGIGLGLLGGSIDLLIGLALLRGRGLLSLLLLRGRIVGVGVGIRVGVILGRVSIYSIVFRDRITNLSIGLGGLLLLALGVGVRVGRLSVGLGGTVGLGLGLLLGVRLAVGIRVRLGLGSLLVLLAVGNRLLGGLLLRGLVRIRAVRGLSLRLALLGVRVLLFLRGLLGRRLRLDNLLLLGLLLLLLNLVSGSLGELLRLGLGALRRLGNATLLDRGERLGGLRLLAVLGLRLGHLEMNV